MRAVCVDTAEFLYPDITEYESARAEISVLAVRGSYACGQVMFTKVPGKTLSVETEGFSAELYEMVPVHVERNQNIDIWHLKPHFPERFAPYDIYDCIKPVRDGKLCVKNGTCALYFSVKIDEDAQPGIITGAIKADTVRIPVRIEISPVTVPGETLTMILCYERGNVCTYHGVEEGSPEFEIYRQNGDEVWYYDCCCPRFDGTINRFTDYALLATRYHFWAAYRYGITGYLHWAANNYMPGQDPFTESCPEHHNADSVSFLPAGDTHIMYPGDGEPWMSVRLEAMRASAEEYELLRLLAEKNKETADEICLSVCRSFQDVDYDTGHFRTAREKLIRALEKETIGG